MMRAAVTCALLAALLAAAPCDAARARGAASDAVDAASRPEPVTAETPAYNATVPLATGARASPQMNILQMLGVTAAGATLELSGKCVYGTNCGAKCSTYPNARPSDTLDAACYDHDRCLNEWSSMGYSKARYSCRAPGMQGMVCACERNLASRAWAVYKAKRCSWYAVWCSETYEVAAAFLVGSAMDQRIRCGRC